MQFITKNKEYIVLFVLLIVPFLLWVSTPTAISHFASVYSFLAGLGEISGILGTVLFAFTLILSARVRILEKLFNGLNNLYEQHSKLGQIAFMLLLAHPLFLLGRYAVTSTDIYRFFLITTNWQRDLGIIALYLSIVIIILTLYLRPKYHIWKQIHAFLGLALFLGAVHIYFTPSYVMNHNIFLTVYVLSISAIGVFVWLYRSVLGKTFTREYEYIVEDILYLNSSIVEIEMTPVGDAMKYTPGQFVFVSFSDKNISGEKHPFSITSHNTEGTLKIAVKVLGDYTDTIHQHLSSGARVCVEGPFGSFSYTAEKKKKQIWIAGGIGVTPFVSMAKNILFTPDFDVVMYYAVRNKKEAVFLNLFEQIAAKTKSFKIIPYYSDELGYLTTEIILKDVSDAPERDIFICAPPVMIHALKDSFVKDGVPHIQLFSEEFNL